MRELQAEADELVKAANPKPWRPFSLAVPEDCSDLLYEHLALPPPPSATLGRRGKRSSKVWSQLSSLRSCRMATFLATAALY
jgi:hypothetical protein